MRLTLLILIILACHCIAAAQTPQGKKPVEITPDDFNRTRDITDIKGSSSVFVFRKKPTYRLKRRLKRVKPVPAKPNVAKGKVNTTRYNLPIDAKSAAVWKRLGVTIWRLAPDKGTESDDKDAATITDGESATNQQYKPTRVSAEQMMAAMLLGFGAALDPPQRHVAEAKDETPKGSPESGEPELDD